MIKELFNAFFKKKEKVKSLKTMDELKTYLLNKDSIKKMNDLTIKVLNFLDKAHINKVLAIGVLYTVFSNMEENCNSLDLTHKQSTNTFKSVWRCMDDIMKQKDSFINTEERKEYIG